MSLNESKCKSKRYEQTKAIILVTFTRHKINLVVPVESINCMLKVVKFETVLYTREQIVVINITLYTLFNTQNYLKFHQRCCRFKRADS